MKDWHIGLLLFALILNLTPPHILIWALCIPGLFAIWMLCWMAGWLFVAWRDERALEADTEIDE